jgi:hypothetical protein
MYQISNKETGENLEKFGKCQSVRENSGSVGAVKQFIGLSCCVLDERKKTTHGST